MTYITGKAAARPYESLSNEPRVASLARIGPIRLRCQHGRRATSLSNNFIPALLLPTKPRVPFEPSASTLSWKNHVASISSSDITARLSTFDIFPPSKSPYFTLNYTTPTEKYASFSKQEKRKAVHIEAPIIPGTEEEADHHRAGVAIGRGITPKHSDQHIDSAVYHETGPEDLPKAKDLYIAVENHANLVKPGYDNHGMNKKEAARPNQPVISEYNNPQSYPYRHARESIFTTLSAETFPELDRPSSSFNTILQRPPTPSPNHFKSTVLDQIISDRAARSTGLLDDVLAAGCVGFSSN
ncbi:uncharacterized protein RAG0_11932 [Rhynchosporium agropyri]|uniref:Uncharacterized protein n=1 Tax=Rhynchosporium agropyri TaxID=914238 RepID=A0A1E1L686_9HELO|nr:uncharacterized protein RAG0_11932 [Rhynchosporium agropyri]